MQITPVSVKGMPPPKYHGTTSEVQTRADERAKLMEQRFPGITFSRHVDNQLGVAERKKEGIWWADLPKAIFSKNFPPVSDLSKIDMMMSAYRQHQDDFSHYVSYNDIVFSSSLSFSEVMGILTYLDQTGKSIGFTVNRMGENVYFKVRAKLQSAPSTVSP